MTTTDADSVFDAVSDAIQTVASGGFAIVTDDENRENEGDLVMAAEKATPERINTMIRFARGLICVPMLEPQLRRLGISQMVQHNRESHGTDFTVSVDASAGITTGISAYDRSVTIQLLADPQTSPDALVQPGHIFPLRSRPGGVLERAGHTEAAVDLATLAGLSPVGIICEILNEDGSMARLPDLLRFKEEFQFPLISIAQLIKHRLQSESLVELIGEAPFETSEGPFTLKTFRNRLDGTQHYALVLGDINPQNPALVRMHASSLLEDLFQSHRSRSSGQSLQRSLKLIAKNGSGILVYLDRHAMEQSRARLKQSSQESEQDFRTHGIGTQILQKLGARRIHLLSSQPRKVIGLQGYGLSIEKNLPLYE